MQNINSSITIKKIVALAAFILSWALLLWINFSAELSIAMHIIAIPCLLLITGGYAVYQLEGAQGPAAAVAKKP